jgi:ABC-type transporter Mla subunit MlaD
LDIIAKQVEDALPHVLGLTNTLATLLANGSQAGSNLNTVFLSLQPVATNLAQITSQLREPDGSLGRWLVSTNFGRQLDTALTSANSTLTGIDTNLATLVEKLAVSLDNLSEITSNLNDQVQLNTNMLSSISDAVVHTDQLVQGLKRHWLLKSAFKEKTTNKPPSRVTVPPMGSKR